MHAEALQVIGGRASGAVPLATPAYPIEQAIRSRDPLVRSRLHDEARRRSARHSDAWLYADPEGVRVRATTERALLPLVAHVVERHGNSVVVGAPRVRYVHRPRLSEPWMRIDVSGPAVLLPLVLRDLERRKSRLLRAEELEDRFAIDAEAPLANLLGYADWLDELSEERAEVSMRFARYEAVEVDDGPEAA